MEPNDQAFAVCFGNHLRLVSDKTASTEAIMDGIRAFDKGNTKFPEIGLVEERELGKEPSETSTFRYQPQQTN
jgi:Ca-activated chloride channel family protein